MLYHRQENQHEYLIGYLKSLGDLKLQISGTSQNESKPFGMEESNLYFYKSLGFVLFCFMPVSGMEHEAPLH